MIKSKCLIRGLCVLVDVAWFVFATFLIWRCLVHWHSQRRDIPMYHVQIRGGDIIYRDYWTTSPPPPLITEKPWYETLTNENRH